MAEGYLKLSQWMFEHTDSSKAFMIEDDYSKIISHAEKATVIDPVS